MGPSRYAEMWKESLKVADPARYQALEESGELETMAQARGARAAEQFQGLIVHFRKTERVPPSHFDAVQTLKGMESRAEEIVLDELLEKQAT